MNILIFRDITGPMLARLEAEFPTCIFRVTTDPAQAAAWLDWAEVAFGNLPVTVVQRASKLTWLQIVSAGFDEYRTLHGSSVTVTTAHGVHAPVIAQHVLLMFLLFVRGQPHFSVCQRKHVWDRRPAIPQDPAALTVGLIGYGAVGKEIARLLLPLGTRVVATKLTESNKPPELHELYVWSRLDEMLATCDHVVLTLPLTEATKGVFSAQRLAKIKPGAVLHNIARGQLVDEDALRTLLAEGHLGGAALDVFVEEPLAKESPLWEMPNVVITPHLAGHHRGLAGLLLDRFKSNLRRHLRHESLQHIADFARGY